GTGGRRGRAAGSPVAWGISCSAGGPRIIQPVRRSRLGRGAGGYPPIPLTAYFSPMKLVLFDIDGTLLWTDGAGRRAIRQALLDEAGAAGPLESDRLRG